jgi:hypothetical protein
MKFISPDELEKLFSFDRFLANVDLIFERVFGRNEV